MTRKILDENNQELVKARQAVSDGVNKTLMDIAYLEGVIADILYDQAFNDGIEWYKGQLRELTRLHTEAETLPSKSSELPEIEKIAQDFIMKCIVDVPGLRTSDLTTKASVLPFKPNMTDKTIWLGINRLKNEGRIENKSGRWYSTKVKSKLPDYQVMQYLPDGSKYLGSDVIR